jgi:hypothetical protein
MKTKLLAAAASAIALAFAGTAGAATIYNLNVYDATSGLTGASLGTVTVSGQGTSSTLTFDVLLNSNVSFQQSGNGDWHDAFWFDLDKKSGASTTAFTNSVSFNITSPDGPASGTGDFGTGGDFRAVRDINGLGQGWNSGHDYGLQDSDSSKPIDYYSGHLTFSVTALDGSILSLDPSDSLNGVTVFGGADLRQCNDAGVCKTGPVGFSLASAAPEPGSWALMIMGFGAVGATFRRRRSVLALAR